MKRGASRGQQGLTIIEVLVAVAIIGISVSILMTASLSSIRHNAVSGSRTQAAQVLGFLSRLASFGDENMFAADPEWDYGALPLAFPELASEGGRTDPDLYRASVVALGSVGLGQAQQVHYQVSVCWLAGADEHCVRADTAGPVPGGVSGPPPPLGYL